MLGVPAVKLLLHDKSSSENNLMDSLRCLSDKSLLSTADFNVISQASSELLIFCFITSTTLLCDSHRRWKYVNLPTNFYKTIIWEHNWTHWSLTFSKSKRFCNIENNSCLRYKCNHFAIINNKRWCLKITICAINQSNCLHFYM